jgi:hypothetical protein
VGTVEDYVRLNSDYSTVDLNEVTLLKEYYKKSKPHLDDERRYKSSFLEDNFIVLTKTIDEERDIRKTKACV